MDDVLLITGDGEEMLDITYNTIQPYHIEFGQIKESRTDHRKNRKNPNHDSKHCTKLLITLTRGVCRGLPCYAASPEKLFSFWGKDNYGSPWLM